MFFTGEVLYFLALDVRQWRLCENSFSQLHFHVDAAGDFMEYTLYDD